MQNHQRGPMEVLSSFARDELIGLPQRCLAEKRLYDTARR